MRATAGKGWWLCPPPGGFRWDSLNNHNNKQVKTEMGLAPDEREGKDGLGDTKNSGRSAVGGFLAGALQPAY